MSMISQFQNLYSSAYHVLWDIYTISYSITTVRLYRQGPMQLVQFIVESFWYCYMETNSCFLYPAWHEGNFVNVFYIPSTQLHISLWLFHIGEKVKKTYIAIICNDTWHYSRTIANKLMIPTENIAGLPVTFYSIHINYFLVDIIMLM